MPVCPIKMSVLSRATRKSCSHDLPRSPSRHNAGQRSPKGHQRSRNGFLRICPCDVVKLKILTFWSRSRVPNVILTSRVTWPSPPHHVTWHENPENSDIWVVTYQMKGGHLLSMLMGANGVLAGNLKFEILARNLKFWREIWTLNFFF